MDGKHPNRQKDKLNPYVLSVEKDEYYVSFPDGQGVQHKEKISRELYELFDRFELEDISQLNVISRYQEHSELTEGTLNQRALVQPEAMEDGVYRKIMYDQLHTAIGKLPDIQRRRVGNILPGVYKIEELLPKDSLYYCKSENPQTVTVKQGETAEVSFTNALRPGKITIAKHEKEARAKHESDQASSAAG